jgi:hypothetical protein
MNNKSSIKLNLTDPERSLLRANKIRKSDLIDYAPDEIEVLLQVSPDRARELFALVDFQRIPTVGIRFAEDLIFLGYFSVEELKGKNGAILLDTYEKKKKYRTDPCVEDQFRLVAYFANSGDYSKKWWDFTAERKAYRIKNGYPKDRPEINWTEIYYG